MSRTGPLFTKKGTLIYHITYGYEKSLPEDLRKQIKDSYSDYDITRGNKSERSRPGNMGS